jgi:hypothetical protein
MRKDALVFLLSTFIAWLSLLLSPARSGAG